MRLSLPSMDTPERPAVHDADRLLYLRSYLLMRTVIGFMGLLLPTWLLLVGGPILEGTFQPRGSLSAYYHSGVRDFFVACLCVIGLFLITYMWFHYNWDNLLSIVAGVAALGVAFLPTKGETVTRLQEKLGETLVAGMHFTSAAIFILSLAAISWLFGKREAARTDRPTSPQLRKWFHWGCSIVIVLAVIGIVVTKALKQFDDYSLLVGESIAVLAFGSSWLVKGLELKALLRPLRS